MLNFVCRGIRQFSCFESLNYLILLVVQHVTSYQSVGASAVRVRTTILFIHLDGLLLRNKQRPLMAATMNSFYEGVTVYLWHVINEVLSIVFL